MFYTPKNCDFQDNTRFHSFYPPSGEDSVMESGGSVNHQAFPVRRVASVYTSSR
jgi:hypothetical protein